MASRHRLKVWVLVGLCATSHAALAQRASQPPRTTGEWLVDLARDHALMVRGKSTAADVQRVRTYLEAATRVDPNQVHAWELLYELALLDGDDAAAAAAASSLLQADPAHERAFECWLQAGVRAAPTLERRVAWLESVGETGRPAWQRSMVFTALAAAALEQLDLPRARRMVEQAIELEPANIAAARLMLDVLRQDTDAPAADWLRAQLRVLQLAPLSSQAAWQIAAILDGEAFASEAARFFDYALEMHRRVYPATPIPGAFWLAMARNRAVLGRLDEAVEFARKAIAADPQVAAEAGFLLYYLHSRLGDGLANRIKAEMVQRFSAIDDPEQAPSNEVAQAAWFFLTVEPVPDRALAFATSAHTRVPGDAFAQRVYGWALAANQQLDAARTLLKPIATRDVFAAYRLAALALATGDVEEARTVLGAIEVRPTGGVAAEALAALERSVADPTIPVPLTWPFAATKPSATAPTTRAGAAETQPTEPPALPPVNRPSGPRADALARLLGEFDDRVLDYFRDPSRFVELRIDLPNRSPGVGEPWVAEFSLTNRGPFVVTLGPNAMLNPVIVVSLAMEGDQRRGYPGYATIGLDRQRLIRPGETIRVRRTLDVGPPRRASRDTPQQAQRVTLNAVLDGMLGSDGAWKPGPTGQALASPVYFNRQPFMSDRATLSALLGGVQSEAPIRLRAIEVIVSLIAERQRADLKRLSYTPSELPIDRLRAALLVALDSADADLRARALEALLYAGLDRSLVAAVEPSLTHENWLVRLMAVQVVARQGATVQGQIERAAKDDADPLVRAMAGAILAGWEQAAR